MSRRVRRTFTPEFKAKVVLDVLPGTAIQAEVCRKHQISPSLFALWKATLLDRLPIVFQSDEEHSAEAARVAGLERLGQQALELADLKKLRRGRVGRDQRRQVATHLAGEYPVRWLCRLFGCHRAGLYRDLPIRAPIFSSDGVYLLGGDRCRATTPRNWTGSGRTCTCWRG
jgi:transposase